MKRDVGRSRVYEAERMAQLLIERAQTGSRIIQIAGTQVTAPPEARFGSTESVRAYLDDVLAMPAVRERFPRAARPVRLRTRRGDRAAHYERDDAVIAVPDSAGGAWALRELVILHELAHHLDDALITDMEAAAHGPGFVESLIDLVGLVLGPEAGFVYRGVFTDSGAR